MKKRKTFKTLTKSNVVLIKQPVKYSERDKQGKVVKVRQIQYCENMDVIFADEQKKIDPKVKPTPIYFNKGVLMVEEDNIGLIKFLESHPDNQANGGNRFKMMDVEKEQKYQIAGFEALDEARSLLMKATEAQSRSLALWFLGSSFVKTSVNKIKLTLRQKLEGDAKFVTELTKFMKEKNNNEKLVVTLALSKDVIRVFEGRKIVWADSGEVIYTSGQAKDVIRDFAVFVKTDEEGRQYLKTITEKLNKLKK